MSWKEGILIVSWLCVFSVSEANVASCNLVVECANTLAFCIEGICECRLGYIPDSGECKSSSITVGLSTQSTNVMYGSDAMLTATITSEISLNPVKWLKGSTELAIAPPKYTQNGVGPVLLTIKNVNFDDAGVYQVEASNSAGITKTSNQVSLTVTGEKPTVTVLGTITETATTITIHCTVSVSHGSPALTTIYWLLNGRNRDISDSIKYSGGIVSNPSLFIHNIGPTDAGEYHCGATNLVGSTTSSQSVTLAPPSGVTFSQQPVGAVYHGTSIIFTGSYTSFLSVTDIKWQKLNGNYNFVDIDITADKHTGSSVTGPSPKLVINPVQFIDETLYRLVVSNGVGLSSSNLITLNAIGGNLTVTAGANVTGRAGGSVTIGCTVTGPEVNNIQWSKYTNNIPVNITIDGQKFSGGSLFTKALTINSLTNDDARQYQCTASNPGGVYPSTTRVTVQINYGQFNEDCSNLELCDSSKFLTCTNNNCICMSTHYHKNQMCYQKTWLAPAIIALNGTTNMLSIFWTNPTTHYELVSGYEVKWRETGVSAYSSGTLSRTVNYYTVSSNLTPGQLYIVNVISHVTLTDPAVSVVVTSGDGTVRLVPSAPGPVIPSQSDFAHNNFQIKWTAPVNTVVTKYEVALNDMTYFTMSNDTMYQFTGKVFVPGKSYVISILTVSGTTNVKKSREHTELIRMTPTNPNPPINLHCPQSPLDISLEISWTAPAEPNGLVLKYQINVSPGNLQQYTSSNETHKNVEGLTPEQMYTFTVRTINDAVDSTSEPSQSRTCTTKNGVSSAPTNLKIHEVQSRGFRIDFNNPDDVKGILAAYKIIISKGGTCVQQILIFGHCSLCKSTVGCPPPINVTIPNITNAVSYIASGLDPYTHYMVKVAAINGGGEGHPVNTIIKTEEEVPLLPGQITASNIQSSSLTLAWTLPDPSPGNTTYTVYTYEGIDDIGTNFLMKEPTKVYGFDTKTLSVTGLEEYWPYKFKVDAATVKGNKTSVFSSIFKTKQAPPGKVLNFTVQKKGYDYRTAYVSWSPPALEDYNGVLKDYLFSNNHTGAMKEEQIPVLLSQAIVERKIPVTPEAVYSIEVVLQNYESMKSQTSMQVYKAPPGPPAVTDIEPVTTKPGQHDLTENTIAIDINTEYFKNDENGKQVFFGIAVCAKSNCKDKGQKTLKSVWRDLPNWHKARTSGFQLYRLTNDTFMDDVRLGDSRQRRSTINVSTLKFIIGEDQTCPSLNQDVYCNGPLTAGTSYIVVIFACTNGGCTYYQTAEAFVTQQQPIDFTNYSPIIGSVVAVTLVVALVVIGIFLWRKNRRHRERKRHKDQANTYADLNLDERTRADQPYSLLGHGSRAMKSKSVPLNSFFDYVVDLLRNNRQKLTKEYNDLLQYTERAASTVASSKNNVSKNRGNIIPYDFNRVKLCSRGAGDYIDASVLLDKFYILTSYPIAKTFGNFWQMVWEQDVSTIVVITGQCNARESWYFSDMEGTVRSIERIDVELLAKFKSSESVTMRKIKMSRGKHSKVVNHFHVISLDITDLPDQILALINTRTQNDVQNTGPQVVHGGCTGIDNSGVYIAVDHVMKSIVSEGNEIDVYGTARTVMKERMFSISSLEQYSAIYICLQKYVQNSSACKNDATGAYEYLP